MNDLKNNRTFWARLNMGIVIVGMVLVLVGLQFPDENLQITFCNVGQGDATLVSFKNYQLLIDGGPNNSVLTCLGKNMSFWDRQIEMVVLTHPQADHMTGLIEVFNRYEVKKLVVSNVVNDSSEFWKFYEVVIQEEVEIFSPKRGDKFKMGLVDLQVIGPETQEKTISWQKDEDRQVLGAKAYKGDLNDKSVILTVKFGEFDLFLTGDIDKRIEKQLVSEGLVSEVEVLKVAHHGSRYSSSEEFLKKISPKLAVIEVGKNWFGHPTQVVLDRLEKVGAKVLRTDEDGMVIVKSDGKSWWIE